MKKVFDFLVGIICTILIIAGVIFIIGSFVSKDGDQMVSFLAGLSCVTSCLILYGFSILVDAATIYIDKNIKKPADLCQ